MRVVLFGCLTVMVFSLSLPVFAVPPTYLCSGRLRTTTATNVTCQNAWQTCPIGSIVIHPECTRSCATSAVAVCFRLQEQQKIKCRESRTKRPCTQEVLRWRQTCQKLSIKAQQECQTHAKISACLRTFQSSRKTCEQAKQKGTAFCVRSYRQRLEICRRLLVKFRQQRRYVCDPLFDSCINRCTQEDWPCRKSCFAQRYDCIQQESEQDKLCRNIGLQLSGECGRKVIRQFQACLRKHEDTLTQCTESRQRQRTLCEIDVGQTYTHCIEDTEKVRLQCWFRQMDWKDLCSGTAFRRCYDPLRKKHESCLLSCPRCKIVP